VELELDDRCPFLDRPEDDEERRRWHDQFEVRIRDVGSRAVAHLARGDALLFRTTSGTRLPGNPRLGSDPILRFLALLDAAPLDGGTTGARPRGGA
jgi:hypothetical protein